MRRRDFVAMLGLAAGGAPLGAASQPAAKMYRLGTLTPGVPIDAASPPGKVIVDTLAARGYRLGDNLSFTAKGAGGHVEQLPQITQQMAADGIGVLIVVSYPAAVAAKKAGLPTVAASGVGDPVADGLVASLAHPGGTITGISDDAAQLSTKRLQLLKQLVPGLKVVAMLWNKDDLGMSLRYEASKKAAEALGVTVQALGVREPDDFDEAFAAMTSAPPGAILMVSDALTLLNRKRVMEYAEAHRLPAIYEVDALVREGGLMSYGADPHESYERAAALADRIFKGAKPGDLPFEQPTRYLFVINLKAAQKIGLEVPPTVLALADQVVE